MRNFILCILLLPAFSSMAQEVNTPLKKDSIPFFSVGGATGVNSVGGMLGVVLGLKASDEFYLRAGFGIGGWGRKFSAEFRYELKTTNSWSFGFGYSSCSGQDKFNTSLETSDSGKVAMRPVTVQLIRSSTINLMTGYKWVFKKRNHFFLDIGYAIPVETEPYRVLVGAMLTDKGKEVLNRRQPGGIILGFGILFGVK